MSHRLVQIGRIDGPTEYFVKIIAAIRSERSDQSQIIGRVRHVVDTRCAPQGGG